LGSRAPVTDGKVATRREVRVGVRQGDRLEIVEGLVAGDRLIVQGAHLLRENNPITLVAEGKRASP
jgi:multidrug efflux system membrane fusion protein